MIYLDTFLARLRCPFHSLINISIDDTPTVLFIIALLLS